MAQKYDVTFEVTMTVKDEFRSWAEKKGMERLLGIKGVKSVDLPEDYYDDDDTDLTDNPCQKYGCTC